MATIKNYRDLEVWQLSMDFVEAIYKALKTFPPEERYGICDQIRRAAVSVPSNIAEVFGRDTPKEFAHFLSIARGSLYETMTQLELASRLGYLSSNSGLYPQAVFNREDVEHPQKTPRVSLSLTNYQLPINQLPPFSPPRGRRTGRPGRSACRP